MTHTVMCLPGIVGTLNGVLHPCYSYIADEIFSVAGIRIPWRFILWSTLATTLATSTFILIAIRYEMPRPHAARVKAAWWWNLLSVSLQAPFVLAMAAFFLMMAAGGMDHFRD